MKIALLITAIIVAFLVLMLYRNFALPDTLGVVEGRLADLPSTPNAISSQSEEEGRAVVPFPFIGSLEDSKSRLVSVLNDAPNIDIRSDQPTYIHAVAVTETMKFRDDLEFVFDDEQKIIHFRSASRVGYSDRGMNRSRYDILFKAYMSKE